MQRLPAFAVFFTAATSIVLVIAGCQAEPTPPTPVPHKASPSYEAPLEQTTDLDPAEPATEVFDTSMHSIDDPDSIWVVMNKQRPLNPIDYYPSDLVVPPGVDNPRGLMVRKVAADALSEMFHAAQADGEWFRIGSAFRDYGYQAGLYETYVARDGQASADTYSARPGHSEHQTGLTVDLDDGSDCYLYACFGETSAGVWLAEHAVEYGFILRYPEKAEPITGYIYEPWHFRYVGAELASEMRSSQTPTLEAMFELEHAPTYAE